MRDYEEFEDYDALVDAHFRIDHDAFIEKFNKRMRYSRMPPAPPVAKRLEYFRAYKARKRLDRDLIGAFRTEGPKKKPLSITLGAHTFAIHVSNIEFHQPTETVGWLGRVATVAAGPAKFICRAHINSDDDPLMLAHKCEQVRRSMYAGHRTFYMDNYRFEIAELEFGFWEGEMKTDFVFEHRIDPTFLEHTEPRKTEARHRERFRKFLKRLEQ